MGTHGVELPRADGEKVRWRILHLEDDKFDREIVREALEAEGIRSDYCYATSLEELAEALAAGSYDLILSDFTLPGYDGSAALALARKTCPDVPYIFVSGTIGEKRAVESLKNGATDYVLKDDLQRLLPAIRRALREACERKQRCAVENALRQSEERYRLLFEQHPQPMWVYDLETLRFLAVNEAAMNTYGYTREEFLRMTLADIRPPEDVPALLANLSAVRKKQEPPSRVWRHRKKDGTIIEVELRSHDLAFAGQAARVVTVDDVTARRSTEERFTAIFHSAPVAIGYGTLDGKILDVNERIVELLGYSREEMIGRTVHELQIWANPAQRTPLIAALQAGQPVRNEEVMFRRKTGEVRTGLLSMEIVRVANDALLLTMIVDVTERKSLEAQLHRANRVESVGRLASGIAHDMNNILAPIMMAAPMLRLHLPPVEAEQTLATIEISARRGADLVRQLLVFGRGIEGERGPVFPGDLVKDITRIATQTFPKNITIDTRVAADVCAIRGDTSQLHQILLNLCVNARDAMPRGGTLTVGAENRRVDEGLASGHPGARPGPFVRVTIADTGTGIPPEISERIFDPFFTTKGINQGTGLGLSTVLAIVKSHGGFINFQSRIDHGTTFDVFLPAMPGADGAAAMAAEPPAPRGRDELILVVDDEPSIRSVLRDTLVCHGYRALVAGDGAEAAALFARHLAEIQMVITDLDMPVMDGASLIRVLKRMNPDIPIVVSTGIAPVKIAEARAAELQALGVQVALTKPYTPARLLTVVRQGFGN